MNKDKGNANTGLFQGAFKQRPPMQIPIIDAEDNVVRCPNCSWELEEDSGCTQCGYRRDLDSQADSNEWSEAEENSEMADYFDEELEDGFEEDIEALEAIQFGPNHYSLPWPSFYTEHARSYGGWRTEPRTINISDHDEDEEEEDDYEDAEMDSFIDDDEHEEEDSGSASDRSTVVDSYAPSSQVHYNESQMGSDMPVSQEDEYVDTDEEIEENEHEDDDVDGVDEDLDEDEDEEGEGEDDDDDEEPIRAPVTAQRRQPLRPTGTLTRRGATAPRIPNTRQPSTRQRAGQEVPRSQPQSSATGSSAFNTINISDDSDDEPVAPTRRRGQARGIF